MKWDEPQPNPAPWPGPIALLGLALIIVLIIWSTGCTSTFYGPDGKPSARIMGDYTYQSAKDGSVSITLKHSPVIRASGVATSQAVAAAGTAASAVILSKP